MSYKDSSFSEYIYYGYLWHAKVLFNTKFKNDTKLRK